LTSFGFLLLFHIRADGRSLRIRKGYGEESPDLWASGAGRKPGLLWGDPKETESATETIPPALSG